MAYATSNFKTKKEFKAAVAAGQQVTIFNPSGMFPTKTEGTASVEGPWNPKPHTWYASVEMKGGVVVSVK